MNRKTWTMIFGVLVVSAMILGACSPKVSPTTDATVATEETQAPAETEGESTPAAEETSDVDTEDKSGGRLSYIENGGFYTLDPLMTPWFSISNTAAYDALVLPNLELNDYVGNLAESWVVADDNLSMTFTLRPNIKFHDGTPCDAAAVKYTMDKFLDPEFPHRINSQWPEKIASIEAPDELTLVFTLNEPYAALLADLQLTYVVSPTAYEELGSDDFGRTPVGTGPWIAKEIVEDDHVLYVRNPEYTWGPSYFENTGPVYFDEFYVKYIGDQAATYASIETGEANVVILPTIYLAQAETNADLVINKGIDWSIFYLGYNNSKEPWNNKDFRVALNYAINREEIIVVAFEGEAVEMHNAFPPSMFGYTAELEEEAKSVYTYDPDKAVELLAELGWTDSNGDGTLDKDGKEAVFQFNFPPADEIKRAAEVIQGQLMDIGIKVELGPMEPAAIADMLNKCTNEFFIRAYGLVDGSVVGSVLNSSNIGAGNRVCYASETMDERIKQTEIKMALDERLDAFRDMGRFFYEDSPLIPLWAPYAYVASRTDVKGLVFNEAGGVFFNDAYIEK